MSVWFKLPVNEAVPMERRLGTSDAVVIGLGAMIGAGVFVVFAPAAAVAGTGLLVGLAIAAFIAFCNATSSAQLAARYPMSGGTYVYGREQLGPWWGFAAGWSFVIGKTASCAAMALTFATYVAPTAWRVPVAVLVVAALVAVNYRGVTRTAHMARVIVAVSATALCVALLVAVVGPGAVRELPDLAFGSWYGVLQSAGLLFFAFAGYARIATLGEEVRDPRRTIPRAILIALTVAVILYALVAVVLLVTLGPDRLANSARPLADAVGATGWNWAVPVVVIGAAAASAGALLALIAGVSRTAMAMARERDLPVALSAVHPTVRGTSPCGTCGRCCRDRFGVDNRSSWGDRLFVVRSAALLPRRERECLQPARGGPDVSEVAASGRRGWLCRSGGHTSVDCGCFRGRCCSGRLWVPVDTTEEIQRHVTPQRVHLGRWRSIVGSDREDRPKGKSNGDSSVDSSTDHAGGFASCGRGLRRWCVLQTGATPLGRS